MKIMISQPMRDKTEEQIRNEREELVKKLTEQGHEVVDTVFDDFPNRERHTITLPSEINRIFSKCRLLSMYARLGKCKRLQNRRTMCQRIWQICNVFIGGKLKWKKIKEIMH